MDHKGDRNNIAGKTGSGRYWLSAGADARRSPAAAYAGSGRGVPSTAGRFGDFDATNTGTDLTLEWDSNDPDLHMHLAEAAGADEGDKEGSGWNVEEWGIPDA